MDVSPTQIWSVATALIPFLEHDDANRALMGSNMQRQAVPLLKPEAPLIGTGMERRAAIDTGDVVIADRDGEVTYVDAEKIVVTPRLASKDEYELDKFMRSNQGTIIHQTPDRRRRRQGQGRATCSPTAPRRPAARSRSARTCTVAFMSWEGYNFEDAIIISERLVKDDELTSIHIEEYEIDARTTKLGDEEITRDIPNRSEESLRNLDERGIVRIGAEVVSGDLLVGKVTPKGETELTAEEKLIRAIFKEKAREVRDTSLKVPARRGRRRDRRAHLRPRRRRRPAAGRQQPRPRLRRDEAQDRRGRQARRPPRQQGRHLEDRARGGHAVPRGRHAGRRDPQPARRAEPDEHRPDPRDPPRLGRRQRLVRRRHPGLQGVAARTATASTSPRRCSTAPRVEDVDEALVRWQDEHAERGIDLGDRHEPAPAGQPRRRHDAALQRPHRRALRGPRHRRQHVHPQAAPPRRRQDPRALDRPLLARHPAAAGRQGAVRRPALRRDGGLGARGLRRRVHAPGDAHRQVRRHRRPREGLRVDRQGARTSPSRRSRSRSRCC